jgi:hypothetical protein
MLVSMHIANGPSPRPNTWWMILPSFVVIKRRRTTLQHLGNVGEFLSCVRVYHETAPTAPAAALRETFRPGRERVHKSTNIFTSNSFLGMTAVIQLGGVRWKKNGEAALLMSN